MWTQTLRNLRVRVYLSHHAQYTHSQPIISPNVFNEFLSNLSTGLWDISWHTGNQYALLIPTFLSGGI